jgi:hypothetical protein
MFANSEGRVYPPTAEGQLPTPGQRKYQGYDQAFDNRDEFLTQMNLGRGNRGTWLHASPESDISDEASLLNQMDTGTELGGHPMQSTTPANDYIAQLADAMQASGVKHDYTGLGPAVFGDRPNLPATTLTKAQKAELEAWRDQARQAALPEDAITSAPSRLGKDYQYLEEERNLGSTGPEASMGGYADGGGVLGKYFGHGLGALGALPDTIEAGRLALAGKFLPAAGSATEAASTFLPLPAMAAYMGMKPTELGDDTLAGWKAQELARKQKNINDQ